MIWLFSLGWFQILTWKNIGFLRPQNPPFPPKQNHLGKGTLMDLMDSFLSHDFAVIDTTTAFAVLSPNTAPQLKHERIIMSHHGGSSWEEPWIKKWNGSYRYYLNHSPCTCPKCLLNVVSFPKQNIRINPENKKEHSTFGSKKTQRNKNEQTTPNIKMREWEKNTVFLVLISFANHSGFW